MVGGRSRRKNVQFLIDGHIKKEYVGVFDGCEWFEIDSI